MEEINMFYVVISSILFILVVVIVIKFNDIYIKSLKRINCVGEITLIEIIYENGFCDEKVRYLTVKRTVFSGSQHKMPSISYSIKYADTDESFMGNRDLIQHFVEGTKNELKLK